jgi:RNA polymerase sigma factor (sigma-70 family)
MMITRGAVMDEVWLGPVGGVRLADLVRTHALELTRFAYLIAGDRARAEDLVQDAFFAMYRRFGPELTIERPLSYARRAIVNGHISWRRRAMSREILSERPPDRPVNDAAAAGADNDLWALLDILPYRQRVVLVLRYNVGCDDAEIADLLGCRASSVRSLATRGLARLRPAVTARPDLREVTS